MFGLGGKKEPAVTRVGAREKLRQARRGGGGAPIESTKGGKPTNPAVSVITILTMSIFVAWLMSENLIQTGSMRFKTGIDLVDDFMFSRSFGDGVEYMLLIIGRGIAIFLAAGFLPFAAFAWQRGLDNAHMNPYRVVWGVPVGIALAYLGGVYLVWPIINEVIMGFS